MLFRAASGEIDIMEYRGDRPNEILGTIHYGGTAPNNIHSGSGETKFGTDFSADWHTFGVEWDTNEIKWFCDGKEYHREDIHRSMYSGKGNNPYTKPGQPFDQPFHWILNVAVGGGFFPANVFGSEVTPEEAKHWAKPTMEIDYVRVWEWK
jgi:beta-glucanase (GH16 family)